jgi:hypothetical protein
MRLLFLGGVVLGVFRKVAVRARVGDLLDDAGALDLLAVPELALKDGISRFRHRNLFHCSVPSDLTVEQQKFRSRAEAEFRPRDRGTCGPIRAA